MPTRSLLAFRLWWSQKCALFVVLPGAKFRVFSVFNFSKLFNKFEN